VKFGAVNSSDSRFNRRLALFVLLSFLVLAVAVVLRDGIGATAYQTTDSDGRTMGFNDRLGAEHYLIMVRHFSPMLLFRAEHIYDWILCAAQVVGAVLLLSPARNSTRLTRWYFFLQPVLFPLGVPTLVLAPSLIAGCFKGSMDREGFIDIPFVLAVTQPWWVLTSFAISILLRGPGLGLSRVWGAAREATRIGTRTFVNALR